MVRALEEEQENYKSRLNHFKGIHVQAHSTIESNGAISSSDHRRSKSQASQPLSVEPLEKRNDGYALNRNDVGSKSPLPNDTRDKHPSGKL